ncbi:hypothetical protein Q4I32_005681 [Leishmania shawi]|uniref:Proteophosphoglycan ppg4 n=1 Tax=Leishmania shawi TaxID=5680 RepID=A0AAW3BJJ5_9TRYP
MSSTVRVASGSISVAKPPASSCRMHTPSGSPKADVADSSAGSLSNQESVGAHESARRTRHVTFDEASIGYLGTYGSHRVHEESRPRVPPENVVCGTAMLSSCAANDGGGCQPLAATAASVGKPNADSWGADSEWFNKVFGAQLTPVTATAHSATAVSTSSLAAAASEPPPLPSSTLIVRPSRVSLSSFSASLPLSSTVSELADTAARGTTRRLGTAGPNRGKYTISSSQSFGASAPITRSRTFQSTRVGMSAHLARDSAGAATPVSSNMSVGETSQPTSDGGRYSSPLLTYGHAFFATATRLGNNSVVAPSCSPSAILPPPPLSVRDLRRRSPATPPSLAAFAAVAGCSGADGPCGSSSHRRLSSPSVSFSNIQASLAEVTESGQGTESIKQEASLVPPRTQTLATDQRDDESPTLRAMKLSVGERRLLEAVMTVNVRKRRIAPEIVPFVAPRTNTSASPMSATETPNSKLSSDADGGLNSIPISTSSSTGRAVRALRETTRSMDDPPAKVLSRDVRQSIDVGAPLSSPTASLCSRVSHSAAVDEESSADSSVRTGVFSAQLSSRCSTTALPTTVSATSGMNGNPRSTTVPSADSLSSALSSSLYPSPGQRLSAVRRSGSQTSWKDDTVTAAPSALLSETRRPGAFTPRSHSHRGRMSASQLVHCQSDGCDRDEDESEPHIQVPVPTPRTSAGTSNWAAPRRRSGDRR